MLTTLDSVKKFLRIRTDFDDDSLNQYITMADVMIKEYCKRDFEQRQYTEFYNGTGTRFLLVRQRPLVSVQNLFIDNNGYFGQTPTAFSSTESELVQGRDFAIYLDETPASIQNAGLPWGRSGTIIRINTIWPELNPIYFPGRLTQEVGVAYGNIKVKYTSGYLIVPKDVEFATNMMVATIRRNADSGGFVQSEALGAYNYSLSAANGAGQGPEIGAIRQVLNRYREVSLGEVASYSPGSYGR